ncbi:intraflagellar transport protein 172 [Cystoisospora suis]|uniref:Intraflagellar transport protein 172 n=1 Tax=Cystoisospora suis TaxID=483139 RepID=A0A2C6KMH1_9APIC|nr:intraflagellar transport protein 172 [Cystoisospora suis]
MNGRVRAAQVDGNKSGTVLDGKSGVYCIASNPPGSLLVTGHLDGSVLLSCTDAPLSRFASREIYRFTAATTAVAYSRSCIAAISGWRLAIFDCNGTPVQVTDLEAAFSTPSPIGPLAFHPACDCLAVGSGEDIHLLEKTQPQEEGREPWKLTGEPVALEGVYGISTICWRPGGSDLFCGSRRGSVERCSAFVRRARWRKEFDFIFTSATQVCATRLRDAKTILLCSGGGTEGHADRMTTVAVHGDRFLVVRTDGEHLLLADIERERSSRIRRTWKTKEKVVFDPCGVCMIKYEDSSVAIVILGENEIAGQCPQERKRGVLAAYLTDASTVRYSVYEWQNMTTIRVSGRLLDVGKGKDGSYVALLRQADGTLTEQKLNTALVQLATCIEHKSYCQAISSLVDTWSSCTHEQERLCRSLAAAALSDGMLGVAHFCFAASRDLPKARYLKAATNQLREHAPGHSINGPSSGAHGPATADTVKQYLIDARFEESIRLADREGCGGISKMREEYQEWLLRTGQEEKAAEIQLSEGNFERAVELFMQGGLPSKASGIISTHPDINVFRAELVEATADSLMTCGLLDKAGDLYQVLGDTDAALAAYRQGHAYKKAVELSRQFCPVETRSIEKEWGEWLLSLHQPDAAINHFLEAACKREAVDAAMKAKNWNKAAQLVQDLVASEGGEIARPYLLELAQHCVAAGRLAEAESCFVQADSCTEAVLMYVRAGMVEKGLQVASEHLQERQVKNVVAQVAKQLEISNKLQDAEKAYLTVGLYDEAISLRKNHEQYPEMLQLVSQHRPELLGETYKVLAQEMEAKGNLMAAEQFYIEGGMWKSAVAMFRHLDKWEDAMRVARKEGGEAAYKKVVVALAHERSKLKGYEAAVELLQQYRLPEVAVEVATESKDFDLAFKIAEESAKHLATKVHLKLAAHYEDKGEFGAAENHFILGKKPSEAIEMYQHLHDWDAALRVAEAYDRDAIPALLISRAKNLLAEGDLKVHLAETEEKTRFKEVAAAVAWKLSDRDDSRLEAARLFQAAEQPEEAIKCLIACEEWEKAHQLARALAPECESRVKESHKRKLVAERDEEGLLALGEIHAVLELAAEEGSWERCLNLAQQRAPHEVPRLVNAYCQSLLQAGREEEGARVLLSFPDALAETENLALCRRICRSLHEASEDSGKEDTAAASMRTVKCLLLRLLSPADERVSISISVLHRQAAAASGGTDAIHLLIAHYRTVLDFSKQHLDLLRTTAAKTAVALLRPILVTTGILSGLPRCRYARAARADKAFYEAGLLCKQAGWTNMAFFFLNRYLDIMDMIDDPTAACLDPQDLGLTDIPPPDDLLIPGRHFL